MIDGMHGQLPQSYTGILRETKTLWKTRLWKCRDLGGGEAREVRRSRGHWSNPRLPEPEENGPGQGSGVGLGEKALQLIAHAFLGQDIMEGVDQYPIGSFGQHHFELRRHRTANYA